MGDEIGALSLSHLSRNPDSSDRLTVTASSPARGAVGVYLLLSSTCEGSSMSSAQGITGFHGVRYLVTDVKRAIDFYTTHLGFSLGHQQLPAFATVALGPLTILLSGPTASGSRPLPGGERQGPGGSNRAVLRVRDLPAVIAALRAAGVAFRNTMETGPGGRQIQVLDPDDNPIELFEPGQAR